LTPPSLAALLPDKAAFCAGRTGLPPEEMVRIRGRAYKLLEDSGNVRPDP
jgi:hypothetical protein